MEWLTEPLTLGDHLVQWGVCVPIAAGFVVGIARMAVRGQREGRVTAERGAEVAKVVPFSRPKKSDERRGPWDGEGVEHAAVSGPAWEGKSVRTEGLDVEQLAVVVPLLPRGLEGSARDGWFA